VIRKRELVEERRIYRSDSGEGGDKGELVEEMRV
jgi:hypothetical protein